MANRLLCWMFSNCFNKTFRVLVHCKLIVLIFLFEDKHINLPLRCVYSGHKTKLNILSRVQ